MEMTISSIVDLNADKFPDSEAVIFEDARATYVQLRDRSNQRANALIDLGVNRGDHVAVLATNCMELVETFLGIWRIGAVFVPLNFRSSPEELIYLFNHSESTIIIVLDKFEETVKRITPSLEKIKRILVIGRNPSRKLIDFERKARESDIKCPSVEVMEGDVATILYTAGTTGKPKGVVATHRNWIWACLALRLIADESEAWWTTNGKVLLSGPYFHAGGIINFLVSFFNRSPQVVLKQFNPVMALEMIAKERVNRIQGISTLYNMILRVPDIDRYDLSSIHTLGSGAETMPDETRNRLKKTFRKASIIEGYGMTESCGVITARHKQYTDLKPYSVGVTPLTIQVRVVDEGGNDVASNEIGEIIVRGPNMMKEYFKDPEKTTDALRGDWLWTHDLGRLDEEGFLYIIERKNDMIKTGGENVYPKEVEDVLYRHPKIAEAAVFGTRDPVWGQNVAAAVVLNKGEKMQAEEVIQFCKENLANFKKPKQVEFVDSLPRSPIGKILRNELRKIFESE